MIVYLHGFRSGPQSIKAQKLRARMAERGLAEHFWCEQLPPVPLEAIALAERAIAQSASPVLLVGSSLGGFYANVLAERHGLRAVMVNPFVPHAQFDYKLFLGEHNWLYQPGSFVFTAEHLAQLLSIDVPKPALPGSRWLLAEEGDETLDVRHAVQRFASARQTVLPGGDHGFSRWPDYLDDIVTLWRATR